MTTQTSVRGVTRHPPGRSMTPEEPGSEGRPQSVHPFTEAADAVVHAAAASCAPDTSSCPIDHLELDGKAAIMPGQPAAVITHYHCPGCGWHATTITAKPRRRYRRRVAAYQGDPA